MAIATKPTKTVHRKVIRNANGDLEVIFVDENGNRVKDTKGYKDVSQGNDVGDIISADPTTDNSNSGTPTPVTPTKPSRHKGVGQLAGDDESSTGLQPKGTIVGGILNHMAGNAISGGLQQLYDAGKGIGLFPHGAGPLGIAGVHDEHPVEVPMNASGGSTQTIEVPDAATSKDETPIQKVQGLADKGKDFVTSTVGNIFTNLTGGNKNTVTATNASLEQPGLAKVEMDNNGVRNRPISNDLTTAIQGAVTSVYGPGYTAQVMSGAQPEGPEGTAGTTGTRRHGTGVAGDVIVKAPDGHTLGANELVPLAQHWLASDIGSVGLPLDSKNFTHLDLIGGSSPGSVPLEHGEGRYWYYGGTPTPAISNALQTALLHHVEPQLAVPPDQVAALQNGTAQPQAATPSVDATSPPVSVPTAPSAPIQTLMSPQPQTPAPQPQGTGSQPVAAPTNAGGPPMPAQDTNTVGPSIVQSGGHALPPNAPQQPNAPTAQVQAPHGNPQMAQDAGNVAGSGATVSPAPPQAPAPPQQPPIQPNSATKLNPSGIRVIEVNPDGTPKDPAQAAFLGLTNKFEGSPKPNQAFNYVPITDMSKHPAIYNKEFNTTAAGSYQINKPTWDAWAPKLGVTDFSPASQTQVAWAIAADNYSKQTGGGNLEAALKSNDPNIIATAFTKNANKWSSFPTTIADATPVANQFMTLLNPPASISDQTTAAFKTDTSSGTNNIAAVDSVMNTADNAVAANSSGSPDDHNNNNNSSGFVTKPASGGSTSSSKHGGFGPGSSSEGSSSGNDTSETSQHEANSQDNQSMPSNPGYTGSDNSTQIKLPPSASGNDTRDTSGFASRPGNTQSSSNSNSNSNSASKRWGWSSL